MTQITAQQAAIVLTRIGWPVRRIGLETAVRLFQTSYLGVVSPVHLTVDGIVGPKTSAAIVASAATGKASPHFTWSELQCRCGGLQPGCRGIWASRELLEALEALRAACYPKGLDLRSVCRCPEHNRAVGGASDSQHLYGRAADIPPVVLTATVRRLGRFGGIGFSPSTGEVVHVDVRPDAVAPFADGE